MLQKTRQLTIEQMSVDRVYRPSVPPGAFPRTLEYFYHFEI
jgi:hypothetical protein